VNASLPDAHASNQELPAALAEYAERLLLSTGLSAHDALEIARGALDSPPDLANVADALRAGWLLCEEVAE
jgi:hypothetical protein